MAGRFLSLEEAAAQLGVSIDEVNRLVDRKKLFPMRDGAAVKFKADDIERVARDLGSDDSVAGDLSLDLDQPAAAESVNLVLDEPLEAAESIFGADLPDAAGSSQTIVRGGAGEAAASNVASAAPAEDLVFGSQLGSGGLDSPDLQLESIIEASSPSLVRGPASSAVVRAPGSDSGLTVDIGGGSGLGSFAGLSAASGAGSQLSGVLDEGLSLEDGDVQLSGIDIGGGSGVDASGASFAAGEGLAGEEFQLGEGTADEDSASVVIGTEETGDSSFFADAIEGEGSQLSEDISSDSASVILSGDGGDFTPDSTFSVPQILGLVCCSLLLMFAGFVLYDLVASIGSAAGPSRTGPLVGAMAETFGWR